MPDRNRKPNAPRPEFEIAYCTRELGRRQQRQMLQTQLARFSDSGAISCSHGEDAAPQPELAPPQDDRAG